MLFFYKLLNFDVIYLRTFYSFLYGIGARSKFARIGSSHYLCRINAASIGFEGDSREIVAIITLDDDLIGRRANTPNTNIKVLLNGKRHKLIWGTIWRKFVANQWGRIDRLQLQPMNVE